MREYGSEHPSIQLPDGYFEGLKRYGLELTYVRTGREALMYASCNCKPGKETVILCPAYCCWSMTAPFDFTGWTVVYYRLKQVDYYVTSIRKSIGVCDGALVLSKKPTNKHYIGAEASDFGVLRLGAQKQKGRYAYSKSLDDKSAFLSELRQGEEMIDKINNTPPEERPKVIPKGVKRR